jgi:hypothetical protein
VKRDKITFDMFDIPQPVTGPGSLDCRRQIAGVMSEALKGLDRYLVAAEMSRYLGREISKHMLDAYTSESRENHIPPLDTAMAFDLATQGHALADLYAGKIGGRILLGNDALDAEIGKLERHREETMNKIKALKNQQRGI